MKAEVKIPKGWRRLRRNDRMKSGDMVMLASWHAGMGLTWDEWDRAGMGFSTPGNLVCIRRKPRGAGKEGSDHE